MWGAAMDGRAPRRRRTGNVSGMIDSSTGLAVLVYSRTVGYRHDSIAAGIDAVRTLGRQHGFTVEATEDPAAFTEANLARYGVVAFLNTNGPVLSDPGRAALESYVHAGGGFVGVHSAAATEFDWPFYGALVGAHFDAHPHVQPATVRVADTDHPATAHLPAQWYRIDEWYDYRSNPRSTCRVLLTVDEASYAGGGMGADHPIAWCREYAGGRSFYTGLGHTIEAYSEPAFLAHLLGGISYAAGREA
jgi:type 1 glutamine amidotransferase